MSNLKTRIAIVDDHPMVRERLGQIINQQETMEVCGEADSVRGGFELIRDERPALAIVDITLKGSNGLELVKQLKALSIKVPVIIFSMHDEVTYAQRSLRAGAMGYVTKGQKSEEVLEAIRQVLEGEIYLSPDVASGIVRRLSPKGFDSPSVRAVDRLSDWELSVLEMIGKGQNSRAIAKTINVGVATVDTYRARIKEKLNLQNTFELQHFAIQWLRDMS